MENVSRKQDFLEKTAVGLGFIALFLPIRFFFYTYVSDYWLGSVGLISVIIGVITYLSHKDKFGRFGQLWKKQIYRLARGKIGTIFLVIGVFFAFFFGFSLWAFDAGKDSVAYQVAIIILEEQDIMMSMEPEEAIKQFIETTKRTDFNTLDQASENLVNLLVEDPVKFVDTITMMLAVINTWVGGWLGHFYVILFVQELEKIGLILFFRFFYKGI